jgi:cell shape-determining protein MreC
LYPRGIIIWVVSKIAMDEFGISKTVEVTPAVDFNNLRYVTILKGHDIND